MFKKTMLLMLVVLVAGSFAFAGTGSSASGSQPATKPSASSLTKAEGTVQKVDAKQHSLSVLVGSEAKVFKFDTKTSFISDKKHVKVTDLKEGDKVVVYSDSKNLAHRVEIEGNPATTK